MERMRVQLEDIVIDGAGRNATARVVARPAPDVPDATVQVTVNLVVTPHDTLATLRRRARDEALRFLDVS